MEVIAWHIYPNSIKNTNAIKHSYPIGKKKEKM